MAAEQRVGDQLFVVEVAQFRERAPRARLQLEYAQEDAHAELLVVDARQTRPVGLQQRSLVGRQQVLRVLLEQVLCALLEQVLRVLLEQVLRVLLEQILCVLLEQVLCVVLEQVLRVLLEQVLHVLLAQVLCVLLDRRLALRRTVRLDGNIDLQRCALTRLRTTVGFRRRLHTTHPYNERNYSHSY